LLLSRRLAAIELFYLLGSRKLTKNVW